MVLALIGRPAPEGPGPIELAMVGLVVLAVGGGILLGKPSFPSGAQGVWLMVTLYLYVISWMASSAMGLHYGVPLMGIIRGTISYLVFIPLIIIGLAFKDKNTGVYIFWALLCVGMAHAVYLLYLYFTSSGLSTSTYDVLRQRTSFLESRTTVQIFFAAALLPLAWLGRSWKGMFAGLASLLGLAAAFSTQTRSQLVALTFGYLFFYYFDTAARQGTLFSFNVFIQTSKYVLGAIALFVIGYVFVPILRLWVNILQARTEMVGDNGRIDEEWLPALSFWISKGAKNVLFGIGAGNSFITALGDSRTYIHNHIIYILVYNGLLGLIAFCVFIAIVFYILLSSAVRFGDRVSVAVASLLATMMVYSQLFAVHKLLSYNIMLFLIVSFAIWRMKYNKLLVVPRSSVLHS